MATYTSNYAWTKPGGNDQVDISVLNGNLDSQDAIMHKAFDNMAQAFSQLSTYAVGDIVLYDNDLYKCHTAVVTPGSWTGSTNWTSWTLAEGGGGGGTSDYPDLTNKPQVNGVTLTGNKTTSDLGIDKNAVGLGNVPNVSTNDQTPTFTEASTRNNIASGEKLSVIFGKIQKFFNDLKTVAFSGSYTDLSNKPNAEDIMMSDGVTSVEDKIGEVAEGLSNVMTPNNLLAGKIGAGDTILSHITSPTLPVGISIWYTQNADDSPYTGNVSFTIINKPLLNGTYSCAYMFASSRIFCAQIFNTIPQALTWNELT